MSNDNIENLKTALMRNVEEGEKLNAVIFCGDPDPDALGSGSGIAYFIKHVLEGKADVVYSGKITRRQNKILVKLLNVQVLSEEEFLELDSSKYNCFIGVDLVPSRLKNGNEKLDFNAVFDHHGKKWEREGCHSDIRVVGSCCTIIWEYLRDAGIQFSVEDDEFSNLATLMLFGVRTDTNTLVSEDVTDSDCQAHNEMRKFINRQHLKSIINYTLPAYFFHYQGRMAADSDNTLTEGSYFSGCVGQISPEQEDVLSMLAEERLRQEGITTSIVFGFVENNVVGCLRTQDSSVIPKTFIPAIFGTGGGRGDIGGFSISLGPVGPDGLPDGLRDEAWRNHRNIIFHRIKTACSRS